MLQNADMRTACTLNIELTQRKKVYWLLQYFIININVVFHIFIIIFTWWKYSYSMDKLQYMYFISVEIKCNFIELLISTWKWQVETIIGIHILHCTSFTCVYMNERGAKQKNNFIFEDVLLKTYLPVYNYLYIISNTLHDTVFNVVRYPVKKMLLHETVDMIEYKCCILYCNVLGFFFRALNTSSYKRILYKTWSGRKAISLQ